MGKPGPTQPLTHAALYHCVLRKHVKAPGVEFGSFGPHALRAAAATNALDRTAPTSRKGQEWLSARQRLDHPALRPAPLPPRSQPHFPRGLLNEGISFPIGNPRFGLIAVPL